MNLAEKIQSDLVEAMRAKDELRLSVLRGIKSAIKLKEVEKIRTLDESETIQILQTLVKQRKESIEQFTKGNRPELARKKRKNSASSNPICLEGRPRLKWTQPSAKRLLKRRRIP